MTRIELVTPSLPRKYSTPELHRHIRAGDGTQTRDPQLGRLMLYQLSYSRNVIILKRADNRTIHHYLLLWVGKAGFEPTKAYASRFTVCPSWPLWYFPNISKQRTEPNVRFELTTPRLQITCSGQLS